MKTHAETWAQQKRPKPRQIKEALNFWGDTQLRNNWVRFYSTCTGQGVRMRF